MKATAVRTSRENMLDEFDSVIAETEQLLGTVAGAGMEQAGALRANIEHRIADAAERLARLRTQATEQAGAAARATDRYVHENPWPVIGVAALAGLVAGAWIARR